MGPKIVTVVNSSKLIWFDLIWFGLMLILIIIYVIDSMSMYIYNTSNYNNNNNNNLLSLWIEVMMKYLI